MAFDISGAKKAGYSDQEIADHLAKKNDFDVQGALSSITATKKYLAT